MAPVHHGLPNDTVVIAGAGPVGMLTAAVLAHHGVKSIVFERNLTTTKWPKMDLTNGRSMEIFRHLGMADDLRKQGVPSEIPYTVVYTAGLRDTEDGAAASAPGGHLTQWDLWSVDEWRKVIKERNQDGSQPLEPYQRLSQEVFEAWMKKRCDANPLIDLRFGWKVESVNEDTNGVNTTVTDLASGETHVYRSAYIVGCDGASSKTRACLDIPLDGGPLPVAFLLIHFRSTDLARLYSQGRFWHLFVLDQGALTGVVINQDEKETFTVHCPIPPDVTDPDAFAASITSEDALARAVGGRHGPYPIRIDEVLVRSTWRGSIATAERYAGRHGRAFLAGDSAHQNIPTGGYGMNTGIGDAFDIGWKLAAVIGHDGKGYAKPGLLKSYEQERRPVAQRNVAHAGVHFGVHFQASQLLVDTEKEHGFAKAKEALHKLYKEHDGENHDTGVELGYRYESAVVCLPEVVERAVPEWNPHVYVPTTVPGSRPPHVFLKDDETAIFDLLGKDFTLVEFVPAGTGQTDSGSQLMVEAAAALGVPLKHLRLEGEGVAARLWELPLVLVRPDQHVAWRGTAVRSSSQVQKVMETVVGYNV